MTNALVPPHLQGKNSGDNCYILKPILICSNPRIGSKFIRYSINVHGIKNEEDEPHRKNKNNDVEATTLREKRFGETNRKFLKHYLKRV